MSLQSSWPNCLILPSGLFLTRSSQYSPKQWASSLQPTAFCSLCKTTVTAIYLEWTNDGTFSHIPLPGGVNSRVRLALGLLSAGYTRPCSWKPFRTCLLTSSCWSLHLYKLHANRLGECYLYYAMLKLAEDSALHKGWLPWTEGPAHLKLLTAKSL